MNESTSRDCGIIGAAEVHGQNIEASDRKRLIGSWNLLRLDVSGEGNVLHPYGEHPIGRLTYDEMGRMSAHVMRPGRESAVDDPGAVAKASCDELRKIADGYVGYCGTFTLDEESKTVIHRIEACTLPAWVGMDETRQYEFAGANLVLSTDSGNVVWEVIWERLPDGTSPAGA